MTELNRFKRYLLSIISGLLMVFSYPYTGSIPFLMFFAFIPLLLIEDNIFRKRIRSSNLFLHTYLIFLIYNVGTTWWIWFASPGGAMFAFIINALLMSLVFQAIHITKKHVGIREGYTAFVLFWVGFEYVHYYWELSWPWLNLGNVFARHPQWVQWYSFSGVLAGTAWLLMLNLFGFFLFKNIILKRKSIKSELKLVVFYLFIVLFPLTYSIIQYVTYKEKGIKSEIVITQPNIDPYNEKFLGKIKNQLNKIGDLADRKVTKNTDFVLAPETALPFEFFEEEIQRLIYFHYLLDRKARWKNASLLIGASTMRYYKHKNSRASRKIEGGPGYYESYNSSLLINEYNRPHFVHKSKLVLGVEKVPFSNIFPFLEELSINNGGTTGTLGIEDESQVLKSNGITFAPIVCYESIYGEFITNQCKKGAELLFIITNDGWWKDTPGYKQHLALSRLRAVENRRSIARSANTGISCFINQRGDVIQQTKWWKKDVIRDVIYRNKDKTFYTRFGNILGATVAYASLFLFIFSILKILKNKYLPR
ncbi:MAG: apolipoprotein N-acyltransferase [Flavobacteriia bacterium]|nr:apolipoprotein N-acyltransferase [Flavobacteriia bacterium]